jgi:membrane-bound lytic murein transglycosylase MltF
LRFVKFSRLCFEHMHVSGAAAKCICSLFALLMGRDRRLLPQLRQAVRTASAAALLALPVAIPTSLPFYEPGSLENPLRPPVSPSELADRGVLRVAVEPRTMAYFVHGGKERGFEFELLDRYARGHGARLRVRRVESAGEGAALLRTGRADVAVLPWDDGDTVDGGESVRPYLRSAAGRLTYPETGALFVRADSPELRESLDAYLAHARSAEVLKRLHARYFVQNDGFGATRVAGRWVPTEPRISSYDRLIAKHALRAGFDWRLVAALIHEESRFDPRAVSAKGARGLMQLMPDAAREVGLEQPHGVDSNIRAGVAYLGRLSQKFSEREGEDRLRLVLAAYLLGPAPVLDAKRIAEAMGLDPTRWSGGIELTLPLIESANWLPLVRSPCGGGKQAVGYVNRIFQRYEEYRRTFDERPAETASVVRRNRKLTAG